MNLAGIKMDNKIKLAARKTIERSIRDANEVFSSGGTDARESVYEMESAVVAAVVFEDAQRIVRQFGRNEDPDLR